jgi:hypothetical protein
LEKHRFDLVYFSTTQFACLPLGRLWHRRWAVPFVVDLQDPWRTDYQLAPGARPPGGWKYHFATLQARWLEPWTLRKSAGVIAVSNAYLGQLSRRYAWWKPAHGLTLPMGWAARDFAVASSTRQTVDSNTIRYVGRLGADLQESLTTFLSGLALARQSGPAGIRGEFFGGSYDPNATDTAAVRTAAAFGVEDVISEHPGRIPYLASLAVLKSAGANLILGSDDDGYAPSKIWLVLAADRPWLALARRGTELHRLLAPHTGPGGWLVDPTEAEARRRIAEFCTRVADLAHGSADRETLAHLEARELARDHATFFATILSRR